MMKFIYGIISITIILGLTGCEKAQPYPVTVKTWKSHNDVANWMKSNWSMDKFSQQRLISNTKKLQREGADLSSLTANDISLTPEESYNKRIGHCADAAILIKDALNKINPDYKPKIIFIKNVYGPPHHWVTGFYINNELYVMDYGAGTHWSDMMGIHGPYNSLDEYGDFLRNVNAKNFKFDFVKWRD